MPAAANAGSVEVLCTMTASAMRASLRRTRRSFEVMFWWGSTLWTVHTTRYRSAFARNKKVSDDASATREAIFGGPGSLNAYIQ
jgi:hypothetical protein